MGNYNVTAAWRCGKMYTHEVVLVLLLVGMMVLMLVLVLASTGTGSSRNHGTLSVVKMMNSRSEVMQSKAKSVSSVIINIIHKKLLSIIFTHYMYTHSRRGVSRHGQHSQSGGSHLTVGSQ